MPVAVTATVYCPVVAVGRRRPLLTVSVAVPEAPAMLVVLRAAARGGVVTGAGVPFARVTVPVYPFGETVMVATPFGVPVGQALP